MRNPLHLEAATIQQILQLCILGYQCIVQGCDQQCNWHIVVAEGLGNVVMEEVAGAAVDTLTAGVVMATRMSGIIVGTGCADCVVVLSAGAKASSSMASQSNGQIPVLL